MPILDIQKRARELGRIRIGQKGAKGQPQKLDRFRLTSASRPLLEKVAALYGGEVKEWTPAGGAQQWEAITDATRIPIMVPPQPVSQWYETWTAGGCVHRCDGQTDWITGETCDNDSAVHQQAKPTTRLNVVLRDVEGIGVWRLETHGWNAAVELPQAAEFLAQAGGYVNGWVSLEERVSKSIVDGKPATRRFMVPTIEIDVTPAELMAGKGRVATPQLEGPVARPALEAGPAAADDVVLPTLDDIQAAVSRDVVTSIWRFLKAHDALTPELEAACADRAGEIAAREKTPAGAGQSSAVPAAGGEGDPDAIWQQVLAVAGDLGMSLTDVEADFVQRSGVSSAEASAGEISAYLQALKSQAVPA